MRKEKKEGHSTTPKDGAKKKKKRKTQGAHAGQALHGEALRGVEESPVNTRDFGIDAHGFLETSRGTTIDDTLGSLKRLLLLLSSFYPGQPLPSLAEHRPLRSLLSLRRALCYSCLLRREQSTPSSFSPLPVLFLLRRVYYFSSPLLKAVQPFLRR